MVDKSMIGHKSHDVILESSHRLLELLGPNNIFLSIKNYWQNIGIENVCFYMIRDSGRC